MDQSQSITLNLYLLVVQTPNNIQIWVFLPLCYMEEFPPSLSQTLVIVSLSSMTETVVSLSGVCHVNNITVYSPAGDYTLWRQIKELLKQHYNVAASTTVSCLIPLNISQNSASKPARTVTVALTLKYWTFFIFCGHGQPNYTKPVQYSLFAGTFLLVQDFILLHQG